MRTSQFGRSLGVAFTLLAAPIAWAEPGYQWESTMQMDGMTIPGMGGGSVECVPAKGDRNPGMDDDKCKPIESKQSGNRFYWKAMCDGALTTGEFVYQGDTAYKGTIMIEEGREKHVMKMTGKRLGKCEYSPPKMPVFSMPDMTKDCDQSVRDLQPYMIFSKNSGMCPKHKKSFCTKLGELSPEGFAKVSDQINYESTAEAKRDLPPDGRMSDALKFCNLRFADMQSVQCKRASQGQDYDFMKRYCPAEWKATKLALCSSGRAYTGLCGNGSGDGEDRGTYGGAASQSGGRSSQDSDSSGGIGDSLNKLKGLFGF